MIPSIAVAAGQKNATNGAIVFVASFGQTVLGFAASSVRVVVSHNATSIATSVAVTPLATAGSYNVSVHVLTPQVVAHLAIQILANSSHNQAGTLSRAASTAAFLVFGSLTFTFPRAERCSADSVPPTFAVAVVAGQRDPTNGAITFTITPSEAVFGFSRSAVSVVGFGAVTTANALLSLSRAGSAYRLIISGLSGTGSVSIAIAAAATDAAGNLNLAAPAGSTPSVAFGLPCSGYSLAADTVLLPQQIRSTRRSLSLPSSGSAIRPTARSCSSSSPPRRSAACRLAPSQSPWSAVPSTRPQRVFSCRRRAAPFLPSRLVDCLARVASQSPSLLERSTRQATACFLRWLQVRQRCRQIL